jgi:hypothetical protein
VLCLVFRHANAHGQCQRQPGGDQIAAGQRGADALGHLDGGIQPGIRQDDEELLATKAADDVGTTAEQPQDAGKLLQDVVAHIMAVFVVHHLEVVDVQHQCRQRLLRQRASSQICGR